jgi:hypothetical protein
MNQTSVMTSARLHQSECGVRFSFTAEYLTAYRDFYLHVEQVVFGFFLLFFHLFVCQQWCPHRPKQHSSPREGGAETLILFLVIVLVFYVLLSIYRAGMTDNKSGINQSINCSGILPI